MTNKSRDFSVSLYSMTVVSIAAATLAAVSICIAIFATVYSKALMSDAILSSEQALRQTNTAVSANLDTMKEKLESVMSFVYEDDDPGLFSDKITALTKMQNDIFSVTVYDENGGVVMCAGSGYTLKEHIYEDLSFDKERFDAADEFSLSGPHVQTMYEGVYPWVVTLACKAEEPVLGVGRYVAIDFSFNEIAKYIDGVGVGRHGYCFIIDENGDTVYHPQQQLLYSGLKTEDTSEIGKMEDGVHTEKGLIRTIATTSDGRWRIVGVSYTDEMALERRTQIITSITLTLVCTAFIAGIVMLVYSKIVTAPVRNLIKAMKSFETDADNFVYDDTNEPVTEFRTISYSFKHMSERIKLLMERVRREETELRKTELRALQAQINPHFLYNTLDSIQWMCEKGNTDGATKMVGALARLFRISISRGHELITIKDEVRHAESYLVIQSYRYRNQFSYEFDVDRELEGYLCNKITIQPLIENAIYHGIDRMVDEGRITVSVKNANDGTDDIFITVADNGVGMTEEQCFKVLHKERSDSSGIGVKNVNDRLKIYFGDRYGISIESELDVGTTVKVRIPKVEKEEEYVT